MEKDFDFTSIGKRMPYKTPDNLFNDIEDNVWKQLGRRPVMSAKKKRHSVSTAMAVISIAACIALLFVIHHRTENKTNEEANIEQAFANLCTEDQTYLLNAYENDIFLNQQNN